MINRTFLSLLSLAAAALLIANAPVIAGERGIVAAPVGESETPEIVYLPREMVTVETAAGQDYLFEVEMATAAAEQSRGLMYRTHLNNDSGMLFLFSGEDERSFWMRNTYIPLDLIFIGRDGVIRHIHHSARPQDDTQITSERPAMAVLEINGGLAGTLDIREGDKVIHPAFRNILAP